MRHRKKDIPPAAPKPLLKRAAKRKASEEARRQATAQEPTRLFPTGPKLLLADPDPDRLMTLYPWFESEFTVIHGCSEASELVSQARRLQPEAAFIHTELAQKSNWKLIRELKRAAPSMKIAILSGSRNVEALRHAMQSGAREFFVEDLPPQEMLLGLQSMLNPELRRAPKSQENAGAGTWCFANPSGGSGQSTLVLALAQALQMKNKRVAVVDADLLFGDLNFYLSLPKTAPTFEDICRDYPHGSLPSEMLLDYGHVHPAGFTMFHGPETMEAVAEIDPHRLCQIIAKLEGAFDYVLVDLPAGLQDPFLPLLDQARFVFASGDNRLSSLKNMSNFLDLLYKIRCQPSKVHPILTRIRPGGPAKKDFLQTLDRLGTKTVHELPYDPVHVEDAILGGEPVTGRSPESEYTLGIQKLLKELLGFHANRAQARESDSLLGNLFQGKLANLF